MASVGSTGGATAAAPMRATGELDLTVGSRGPAVDTLKDRLRALHYIPGGGDAFDARTHDAVVAFQKVNGLGRDGVVGPQTRAALADPRRPRLGTGPEERFIVDRSDQVAFNVHDGRLDYVVNVSTGNPDLTDGQGDLTPRGRRNIYFKHAGTQDGRLGAMYWPSYFRGDFGIHGANFVPPYPDSHGCVRVPRWAERRVYDDLPIGRQVHVRE